MPVVKAQHNLIARQSAIVMNMSDLEQQADKLVAQARQQAQQIIEQAKQQALQDGEVIREQARQAGHDEGYAAGFQEGQQKGHDEAVVQTKAGLDGLIERWGKTLEGFQNNLPTHLADLRVDLVKLALAIANKVTHLEAQQNQEVVLANVQEALGLVTAGRSVVIQIHPDEVAVLENYLPEMVARFRGVVSVDLKPDATITPGGCILSFGGGQVDARLETQIQRIAEELVGSSA